MGVLDRDDVFRAAQEIYERNHHASVPSKLELCFAVDLFLQGCNTREDKVAMLGNIAEKRALHMQAGAESPLGQDTIDMIDAVSAAASLVLARMN